MDASESLLLCQHHIFGFDDYGFAKFAKCEDVDHERCHTYRDKRYSNEELKAWEKLLSSWNVSKLRLSSKVTQYIERGVPQQYRGLLWRRLLDVEAIKATTKFNYQDELGRVRDQLVDLGISEYGGQKALDFLGEMEADKFCVKYGDISMEAIRHIFLDLDRSYPTHEMFMGQGPRAREGRAAMFRVLAAYARYNKTVEYCQGMSVIAGMFLMQTAGDEESSFWCMVSLLERHKYIMGYFHEQMTRLRQHACVHTKLLQQRQPELHKHLVKLGIDPLMFMTPWFMALFTSLVCWDTVLAIWDLLLLQGHVALFRVSLAILQVSSKRLLASKELGQALPLLLHLPAELIRYESLMPAILATEVHDWEVTSLLAIVQEDAATTPSDSKGKKRKHHSGNEAGPLEEQDSKRHKSGPTVPAQKPMTVRPLVAALTPSGKRAKQLRQPVNVDRSTRRSLRLGQQYSVPEPAASYGASPVTEANKKTDTSPTKSSKSPHNSKEAPMSTASEKRISLGEEANENSFLQIKDRLEEIKSSSVPVRRSPRLAPGHALRVINQSPDNGLWPNMSKASVKHAFRVFNTATPLASRHKPATIPATPPFIASPDVEMKLIKGKLQIMDF